MSRWRDVAIIVDRQEKNRQQGCWRSRVRVEEITVMHTASVPEVRFAEFVPGYIVKEGVRAGRDVRHGIII